MSDTPQTKNSRNSRNSRTLHQLHLTITGLVQGVGFRPFVYRLARDIGLSGWISNTSGGVVIEAEGTQQQLDSFCNRLQEEHPPHSRLDSFQRDIRAFSEPSFPEGEFVIRPSRMQAEDRPALVLPDLATCKACRHELFSPDNRRYRYPFINCIHCGPRYSIIQATPYDRQRTSMASFTMCADCAREYNSPENRRFHAQPNACPVCGPQLSLWDTEGRTIATQEEAIQQAILAIQRGAILALQGLGGFQLCVDAQNGEAVERLRQRKRRPKKPFAMMFPSLEMIQQICECNEQEAQLLTSVQAPIVLLRQRVPQPSQPSIARKVAPQGMTWGVMLPYTPLHHLLLEGLQIPLVATSGNLSGEPLCTRPEEALVRLRGVADLYLVHNRPIVHPVDDSVVQVVDGQLQMIRRARGYAPLPVSLDVNIPHTTLAVGADLKAVIAVARQDMVWLSPHIGDLENPLGLEVLTHHQQSLTTFLGSTPGQIVADLHPEYHSQRYAEQMALTQHLPLLYVQHHHAHVLACMAEHRLHGPVLGVVWDGTGYGSDAQIWGGECLKVAADGSFQRFASLRPFPLPGGEQAVHEPRRSALGLLYTMLGDELFDRQDLAVLETFSPPERKLLQQMLQRRVQTPLCTSMGRLFDAIAALLRLCDTVSYEAEAAILLETLASSQTTDDTKTTYPFLLISPDHAETDTKQGDAIYWLDWIPLVRCILDDIAQHTPTATIASHFHHSLGQAIVRMAQASKDTTVLLSGGCFQNRVLLSAAIRALRENGFQVYWPQQIPANDGGIALGQILAAGLRS